MFGLLAGSACASDPSLTLTLVESRGIQDGKSGLTEPSGLAIDPETGGFWIASDDTRQVLRLTGGGGVERFTGKHKAFSDLEGIALDTRHDRLLVVSEARTEIVEIDLTSPDRIRRHALENMKGFDTVSDAFANESNGLEGITVENATGRIFVLKERMPRLLIEIDPDLTAIRNVLLLDPASGFLSPGMPDSRLDVSGLAHDPLRKGFWILSDTDEAVRFVQLDPLRALRIPLFWTDGDQVRPVGNAEGVALSGDGKSLYVVSDDGKDSRLFHYSIDE